MRGMVTAGRCLAIVAVVAHVAALAAPARAQTPIPPSGLEYDDAEIFKPTVDPGPFLSVYDSRTLEPGRFSVGSWASWALEPMDARRRVRGDEENVNVVDNGATLSLLGAVGVLRRLQIGAHLPLYVTDEADVVVGGERLGDTSFNLGDLTLNGKIGLLGGGGDGFGLALVPALGFPTGNRREFAGLGRFSYGGLAAADYRAGLWSLGANFGGMIRDGVGDREGDDGLEDQLRWSLAASRRLGPRWAATAEVYGLTDGDQEFRSPVEIVGAVRWNAGPVDLTFGLGGGVSSGKNAALFRLLLGVTAPLEPAPAAPGRPFAGPAAMAASRKTYVVEDHDRNGQVSPGDVIVYTVNLVNAGPEPARNVVVTDPVPANTDYLAGTIQRNGMPVADSGAYRESPPEIVVRVPSIDASGPGAQATIGFKVRIRSTLDALTTVRNEARVSADGLGELPLPAVETAVFPAAAQREKVVQTTPTAGARKLEVTENIQFDPAAATIRPESFPVLDQVASILGEQPALEIRIVGHTDDTGDELVNVELSQRRAESVKDYLVSRGVAADRLETIGRGEYEPVASNQTEAGRAANRRVEFIVKSP